MLGIFWLFIQIWCGLMATTCCPGKLHFHQSSCSVHSSTILHTMAKVPEVRKIRVSAKGKEFVLLSGHFMQVNRNEYRICGGQKCTKINRYWNRAINFKKCIRDYWRGKMDNDSEKKWGNGKSKSFQNRIYVSRNNKNCGYIV